MLPFSLIHTFLSHSSFLSYPFIAFSFIIYVSLYTSPSSSPFMRRLNSPFHSTFITITVSRCHNPVHRSRHFRVQQHLSKQHRSFSFTCSISIDVGSRLVRYTRGYLRKKERKKERT